MIYIKIDHRECVDTDGGAGAFRNRSGRNGEGPIFMGIAGSPPSKRSWGQPASKAVKWGRYQFVTPLSTARWRFLFRLGDEWWAKWDKYSYGAAARFPIQVGGCSPSALKCFSSVTNVIIFVCQSPKRGVYRCKYIYL